MRLTNVSHCLVSNDPSSFNFPHFLPNNNFLKLLLLPVCNIAPSNSTLPLPLCILPNLYGASNSLATIIVSPKSTSCNISAYLFVYLICAVLYSVRLFLIGRHIYFVNGPASNPSRCNTAPLICLVAPSNSSAQGSTLLIRAF